jgi:hypothetical protein
VAIEAYSAPGFLSDLAAKVLTFSEDAHMESMSTFETDERLQALTPRAPEQLMVGVSLTGPRYRLRATIRST